MKSLIVTTVLAALATTASAEPADSVNVSPLGVTVGTYAATYEHLWGGTHGLIVEGQVGHHSNDNTSQTSVGGGVGYRWHWSGHQNSGFLGVMLEQGLGSGSATENGMTYPMGVRYTTLTANIGKRWMIGDAVNITFRFGLGAGTYAAVTDDTTAGARQAQKDMNDLLQLIPVAFDGELSVGYVF